MLARDLRIARAVIPRAPGHFSSCGMLVADLRRDFVNTWFTALAEASFPAMEAIYAGMERRGREAVARSRVAVSGIAVQRAADMRYVGQEHAVTVDLPLGLFEAEDRDGIKRRFDAVHETRYGYSAAAEQAEIVSLRSAITGLLRKPASRADRRRNGRAAGRSVSRRPAGLFRRASDAMPTRRPTTAHCSLPAIASPGRP